MKKQLLLLTFACIGIGKLFAQHTIIHCGNLIDGISNTVQPNMTIVIAGNKIIAIEKGFRKIAEGEKNIDLSKKTIMPGLMDMHVHLEHETSREQFQARIQNSPADIAYNAQKYAKITLMAGFTTVRDLGGTGVNISLRNAINKGLVVGPRIFTSGKSIATTGGHADPTNGIGQSLHLDPKATDGVVNGIAEARRAVRQRYQDGADCIKITASGGVLSIAKSSKAPQFFDDEMEAIMQTAKDYNFTIAAHAHGAEGMKRAIRAGVTSIEHGTFMDDEAIELFKKYGTFYVPTIIAGKTVADSAKRKGYYHPLVVPKAQEVGPLIQNTFAKAYKAGVRIAFGTDAGVYPHGYNAKEFEYMVEAGMPPMEAIKSATIVAAELLGWKEQVGSIEVGKFADLVASDENPLQNIKTLQKITFVMKDGVVYKQE